MLYIYISSVNTSDQVKWWRAGGQSPQGQLAGRRWVLTRNRFIITCLCSSTLGGRKGGRAHRIVLGSDGHSISSATASAAQVWGLIGSERLRDPVRKFLQERHNVSQLFQFAQRMIIGTAVPATICIPALVQ